MSNGWQPIALSVGNDDHDGPRIDRRGGFLDDVGDIFCRQLIRLAISGKNEANASNCNLILIATGGRCVLSENCVYSLKLF